MILAAVILLSFLTEATLGFGATILSLSLGAHLHPLHVLLPVLVPINLALSAGIAARHRDAIDRRLLLQRILPAMALGLPLGLVAFRLFGPALRPAFGLVVVGIAGLELARLAPARATRPLPRGAGVAALVLAGVLHGAYGTGGPLVVYVSSHELADKRAFRATLASLWIILNVVLAASFIAAGQLGLRSLTLSAQLLPVVALALVGGELVSARVPQRPFRLLVAVTLGAAGLLLFLRGA